MTTSEIERASDLDIELSEMRHCWKTGNWSTAPTTFKLLRGEITVIKRLVLRGARIIVPESLRERALEFAHEGHPQGIVKTKDRLGNKAWWPKMNDIVDVRGVLGANWLPQL